jgi:hypothetical protein
VAQRLRRWRVKDIKGLFILTDSGWFSYQVMTDFPKLASNNRMKTTAEENKNVAQGAFSYYGTYTVNEADKSFTVKIERSSFPNQNGTDGKRIVSAITADEFTYTNPARLAGGTTKLVWRRAK